MKSLFRYPGGKTKLLPQILPFIDESLKQTDAFCDAFVGGGSVLLEVAAKYPHLQLYCNDKDGFVFSFWKLVSSNDWSDLDELKSLIQLKPTIDLFYELRETKPGSLAESAYRAVFFNRTSFSGDMRHAASPIGGRKQSSKYTVDCRYNAKKLTQKIDEVHKLLANRTIVSCQDINDCNVLDKKNISIYLDPPYWHKGKMLYQEYMKEDEHVSLGNYLKNKDNWVLSYDNCSEVLDIYNWANIHYIDASYCIRGNKDSWQKTREVLIIPTKK